MLHESYPDIKIKTCIGFGTREKTKLLTFGGSEGFKFFGGLVRSSYFINFWYYKGPLIPNYEYKLSTDSYAVDTDFKTFYLVKNLNKYFKRFTFLQHKKPKFVYDFCTIVLIKYLALPFEVFF